MLQACPVGSLAVKRGRPVDNKRAVYTHCGPSSFCSASVLFSSKLPIFDVHPIYPQQSARVTMSGLEIVGIVIGSIPLIVSGLEHYAHGVGTIRKIRDASQGFRILARRLRAEYNVYRNTLTILLSECMSIAVEKQDDLINRPTSDEWDDPRVKAALIQRLQGSYDSFVEHVRSIHIALDDLRNKLHIDSSGKGPFSSDGKSFSQAFKKFRFALKESEYTRLIESIGNDVSHIRSLTSQSRVLQETNRRRRAPDYESIRKTASSIFEILQHSLSCGVPHKASIYLKPVSVSVAPKDLGNTFRLILHHGSDQSKQAPWSIQETEMRVLESISSPAITTDAPTAAAGSKGKQKVRFVEPAISTVTSRPQVEKLQHSTVGEIRDLCHRYVYQRSRTVLSRLTVLLSLEKMRAMQCGICLGYLMGVSNQHRHGLYWPHDHLLSPSAFSVSSLANVLQDGNTPGGELTPSNARRLAMALAPWMLRLHSTPWLAPSWDKKDITLIKQGNKILAQHAFITQSLDPMPSLQSKNSDQNVDIAAILIKNRTLFALGIVLIELCMGKTIDNLHLAEELNPDGTKNQLSDWRTADRLVNTQKIHDKFGKR